MGKKPQRHEDTKKNKNKSFFLVSWCLCGFFVVFSFNAFAHEMRPAYLQLHQTSQDTYDVYWKVPGRGENMKLSLYVQFPKDCINLIEPQGFFAENAYTQRWRIKRMGGLSGTTIGIAGLSATLTDVLVRVERFDGSTQVVRLTPSTPSFVVEATAHPFKIARTYLYLGIEHILTGADHLLFVSGLLLLVTGFKRVIKTISAFTVSHSVTLSLATLGFVNIPPAPVEAIIALSIVFVAYEVIQSRTEPQRLAQRKPWAVAFLFGLLHGLGFAGGLSQAGLPAGHIPLALALFSAGVEVGHFTFVALVFALITAARHRSIQPPAWAWRIPPYAIGSAASYWLIARIAAF
jgi:hydrogenase/urease accessory protein HupE